jgi:alkaline phosphatase
MFTDNSAIGVSRRSFLKKGIALPALAVAPTIWAGSGRNGSVAVPTSGNARNVIFMVSDGMSAGTLAMADHLRRRRDGHASHWISLYEKDTAHRVRRGMMDMASLDAVVTDSAAAASSWGCGHRVNNNSVNMAPDGREHRTILEIFRDAGKKTGLVTTTTITHATPAGFSANVPSRAMQDRIAEQYLERQYDVLLGGGNEFFDAGRRRDGRDLYAAYRAAGYGVVRDRAGLSAAPSQGRLLGIFHDGHLPYTLDHVNDTQLAQAVPTLAEMTRAALQRLDADPNGFILQVEGGRVDHGAHGNDASAMLFDQVAFDDAIEAVLQFTDNRDDTLVIITSDHGNGNPALNGMGSGYLQSDPSFDRLLTFRHTNNWILSGLNAESSISAIKERVEAATGLEFTDRQAWDLLDAYRGQFRPTFSLMSSASAVMGQIMANYTAVSFTSGNHTSDFVELAAFGPGSEVITGFTRNTDMFNIMLAAVGIAETASR